MRSIGFPELIAVAIIVLALISLMKRSRSIRVILCCGIIGGIAGFLLRPSVPMVGQLPFDVVLSRGATLPRWQFTLKGPAEISFNYLVAGVLIGCVVGITFVNASSPTSKQHMASSAAAASADTSAPNQKATAHAFCIRCGKALPAGADFCGACGMKKALA